MIKLELLNQNNESKVRKIRREDIPIWFVEDVSATIELSKWGEENNLRGHCYAIKYRDKYIANMVLFRFYWNATKIMKEQSSFIPKWELEIQIS